MRILQLVYKIPWPLYDGGAYGLHYSMKAVNAFAGYHHVLAMAPSRQNTSSMHPLPAWMNEKLVFESIPVDNRIHPISAFLNLWSKEDYFTSRFKNNRYEEKLIQLLKTYNWDFILIEHALFGRYWQIFQQWAKHTPIILRTQNIEHQLWASIAAKENNLFKKSYLNFQVKRLKAFELNLFQQVNGLFLLSESDQLAIQSYQIKTPSVVIPPCTDRFPDTDKPIFPLLSDVCYHLGSMDWKPNQQGMEWFFQAVWPLVTSQNQKVTLAIAGFRMPQECFNWASDHISVEDSPQDAQTWLNDKGILIVPLVSGGGVRIKIIEAMALGKAIISTSVGCYGLGLTHQENIWIADSPSTFANAIIQLVENSQLRNQLGRNAASFAKANFSLQVIADKMQQALNSCFSKTN